MYLKDLINQKKSVCYILSSVYILYNISHNLIWSIKYKGNTVVVTYENNLVPAPGTRLFSYVTTTVFALPQEVIEY